MQCQRNSSDDAWEERSSGVLTGTRGCQSSYNWIEQVDEVGSRSDEISKKKITRESSQEICRGFSGPGTNSRALMCYLESGDMLMEKDSTIGGLPLAG